MSEVRKFKSLSSFVAEYQKRYPESHYFDKATLKWFGESLSTMILLDGTYIVNDIMGKPHECYAINRLQKNYPGGPRRANAYFDVETLEDIVI